MPVPLPPPLQTRPRSALVILSAWVMMVTGVISLPISFLSLLMFLTKSYGTANAGFFDVCLVILGPPVVICVGFGLLHRWRWGLIGTPGTAGYSHGGAGGAAHGP